MSRPYDEPCLLRAIEMSAMAVANGNMPFGAVVADSNGNILKEGHNLSAAKKERGGASDVTRHAEMELVRMVSELDLEIRKECTMYASTEPCVMCAGAIYWSGIGRLVFGASSEELSELSGPGGFDIPVRELYAMGRPGTRQLEIEGPLFSEGAMKVHKECGIWKRATKLPSAQAMADIETERSLFTSGLGAAASTRDLSVPVIDLSQGTDEEIAQQLWDAATTVGFFTLIGHSIPQEVIDAAFQASAAFFSLPQEEKPVMSPFAKELNAGYEYMAQVRPSTGTADQKESIQITAREGVMDSRWPSTPSNFRPVVETLAAEAHKLACRLLDLLEPRACPNLQPGTLAKSHT
jgi:tRNA(Arg) A34 adenosine deaminase TadA